jgi:hypothetical protein
MLTPCAVFAAGIKINGVCQAGDCTPDTLSSGGAASASKTFTLTLGNSDQFQIYTSFNTSNSGGTSFNSSVGGPTVVFTGSNTGTSGADVITIEYLQNQYSTITSGNFSEGFSGTFFGPIAAGSNVKGQQFIGGNGLPVMGPLSSPGPYSGSSSNNPLSGLGNPLLFDFVVTFTVAAGSGVGAGIGTSAPPSSVPALSGWALGVFAIVLLAAGSLALRKRGPSMS